MSTFEAWPKIPRWNRSVVVTEKVDGTNGAIIIERHALGEAACLSESYENGLGKGLHFRFLLASVVVGDSEYHVYAQSRTRLIRPGADDNQGFAAWVVERAPQLAQLLGPGRHFGEFYGKGIARNYGLNHRRFALFNTKRWGTPEAALALAESGLQVDVVPTLQQWGNPDAVVIEDTLHRLRTFGSYLVPGFDKPEGVVLYHTAAGQTFKILLEGDELPKGIVPRAERELEAARAA